jgi:hypothetical protein
LTYFAETFSFIREARAAQWCGPPQAGPGAADGTDFLDEIYQYLRMLIFPGLFMRVSINGAVNWFHSAFSNP